jgi:hypothetical protein
MNEKQIFLDKLLPLFENLGFVCDNKDDVISVANPETGTRCIIDIEDLGVYATDKIKLTQTIKIHSQCNDPMDELMDMSVIGKWNAYAALLALVKDKNGVRLVAKMTLYENSNDVINSIYVPLVYAAVYLSFGLSSFMNKGYPNVIEFLEHGCTPLMTPSLFGVPEDAANSAPNISEVDVKATEEFLRGRGLLSFSGSGGLSVEFPWDSGAISTLFYLMGDENESRNEKRTSLLVIEPTQAHPLLGKGLLARLQLPIGIKPELLPELVNQMNLWEMNSVDMPPFFGSWCIDPKFPSPAYVTFIPSLFSQVVSFRSFISWMWLRHKASMTYLKQEGHGIQ